MKKRFAGYLICSDIDGTLVDSKSCISQENAEAIRWFQEEGGYFTVATGRAPRYITKYQDSFVSNAPIIACNGSYLYDLEKDESVYKCEFRLKYEEFMPIMSNVLPKTNRITLFSEGLDLKRMGVDCEYKDCVYYLPTESFVKNARMLLGQSWLKIVFRFANESDAISARDYLNSTKLGEVICFERSWPIGIEFVGKASTKGLAAQRLKAFLPDVKKLICIGNYENDISMISMADIGVAVSNAEPEVKAVADMITVSNDESALAKLISELPSIEQ